MLHYSSGRRYKIDIMETIHTPEIWITLITPILIIIIIMIIKELQTTEIEEHQESTYCKEINDQLIESEQNCFM